MSEELLESFAEAKPSAEPVIEFRGVSKTYPSGTHALEDVNIRINKGEFVFIVGSSGAGKSTFMKLIMREEKANTGSIQVNGFELTKMRRKNIPMLRRTMGIVFQDFRLIPTMNVFNNVAFAMHVVGQSGRIVRREVSKALSKVGLGDKARSMPMQLSGGEQQRVGLARALVNSPDLIIADEPTGNVDPNMSYEIVSLLTEINKRGTTILMVTHDHNLVRDFKHRVIMLDGGKIVADNAAGGAE
ncbi:MAG: cell division ATP-binding protein FtsE [Clostridia bacterium]|nr:cell division ATP-binding protein FtsE [Clostridia bacterium]